MKSTHRSSTVPSRTAVCTSPRFTQTKRSRSCAPRSIASSASSSTRKDSSASFSNFSRTTFLKNEVDADQATFLARAQIYQGDYHAASHFVEDLRRVRPEDVLRVAQQYMHDFRFVYLGNPDSLSRSIVARF